MLIQLINNMSKKTKISLKGIYTADTRRCFRPLKWLEMAFLFIRKKRKVKTNIKIRAA